MAVGRGNGANMLTKYLAEVGESTPLTASVCVDNPFDLQEATRSFPHHVALDQKLMPGLVDILSANKVLILLALPKNPSNSFHLFSYTHNPYESTGQVIGHFRK